LVQDGAFFWENSQVKVWKGKVRRGTPGSLSATRAPKAPKERAVRLSTRISGCLQTPSHSPTPPRNLDPPTQVEGLPATFLEPENGHFWRGCIYGRGDDHVRFGYFCGAALEYLKVSQGRHRGAGLDDATDRLLIAAGCCGAFSLVERKASPTSGPEPQRRGSRYNPPKPAPTVRLPQTPPNPPQPINTPTNQNQVKNVGADVVHCHDWQSAPVAWGNRGGARCVFTIHNLNYGADLIGRAMAACDVATTVSPTYAREVGFCRSGSGCRLPSP
jgi:hypothetical protein